MSGIVRAKAARMAAAWAVARARKNRAIPAIAQADNY
jgi:hypothetical protein